MARRIILAALITVAAATPVTAQRFEAQPFVGVRWGGAFSVDETIPGGFQETEINPDAGFAWGATLGLNVTDNFGLEFLWSRQSSAINAEPLNASQIFLFDASISQYQGNMLFNLRDPDSRLRPFFLLGLGATNVDPDQEGVDGVVKFSWSLGGGVRTYFSERVGVRAQLRWTPTYVTSEPALFCDVFGFCYVVDEADYANQGEFTTGVIFRF